jgi:hydrogenase maturation factor
MIPVYRQTENICRLLNIDPLGLIGSGSLLICCRNDEAEHLMSRIQGAGIDVTCIGEVLEPGRGIKAVKQEKPASWPCFEVDEITRLF